MRHLKSSVVVALTGVSLLASCCGAAYADEPSGEAQARSLADEVLQKAGDSGPEGLGAWTRSVIERALERAGGAAPDGVVGNMAGEDPDTSPALLPAERHATSVRAGFDTRGGAQVVVFMSLSVPAPSWREWAREVALAGAPLVLRGVGPAGMKATVREIGARLGGAEAGVGIDPRLFRLFGIERVPAVAVVPGGAPPCRSRGCAGDPAPLHDRVTGNIGLAAALEAIAAEGEAGRDVARRTLDRLTLVPERGDER